MCCPSESKFLAGAPGVDRKTFETNTPLIKVFEKGRRYTSPGDPARGFFLRARPWIVNAPAASL